MRLNKKFLTLTAITTATGLVAIAAQAAGGGNPVLEFIDTTGQAMMAGGVGTAICGVSAMGYGLAVGARESLMQKGGQVGIGGTLAGGAGGVVALAIPGAGAGASINLANATSWVHAVASLLG